MRLKLLLLFLLLSPVLLKAQQDTIKTLIITESRMDRDDNCYVEITNIGTKPVQLSDFKFGRYSPWEANAPFSSSTYIMLPNKSLEPGKSYVIASVLDFVEEQHRIKPDFYDERITKKEMWTLPDLKLHKSEPNGDATDSITAGWDVMGTWNGRDCWYLEQHFANGDSAVVDQVGGVFDSSNGRNQDKAYDVAGVTNATGNSMLMRKFTTKQGNLNFGAARGVGSNDSEWMPVPQLFGGWEPYRAVFWTVGNHGDYKLDNNTLVSTTATVDFANSTITVPWGTRNNDDFMKVFQKKPGIAWHYDLSKAREDSAYMSARVGDTITIYVCGSSLQFKKFGIKVAAPTAGANIVVPKFNTDADGFYGTWINSGSTSSMFDVTVDAPVIDTITNGLFGINYSTSVDTLFKYLEKAPKATWKMVWVDGIERPEVKNGDKLKVTAENGSVKDYYIKVRGYQANHNADLASITWPDMPLEYRGLYGWAGDTLPNFASAVYNYRVMIPADVDGIPALIAKPLRLNSKVQVTRATSLNGTKEQATVTFKVTADDGTTVRTYVVELEKEKAPENVQPFNAEPFISEIVFQDQWANWFVEIANPGNQILDLSNYMIIHSYDVNPTSALDDYSAADAWAGRYRRYVPGYRWVDEATWAVSPSMLIQDVNVNALVYPGDVFVLASINTTWGKGYPWFASKNADVIFDTGKNPWGETVAHNRTAAGEWSNHSYYLFKILNDSIKLGLKPATNPADFELIEVFGMGDNSAWKVGGKSFGQTSTVIRKPTVYKGKTGFKESFGTTPDESEWILKDRAYWNSQNVWWVDDIMNDGLDVGKHFMNPVTVYKSTVSSPFYKVSEGYSMKENIKGIKTGTTATTFLGNIVKAHEKQTLTLKGKNGMLAMNAVLSLNDTLVVLSADSTNTTKYILNVTPEGFSSNAVLTSTRYKVTIDQQPKSAGETSAEAGKGNITGFDYGTSVRTILANVQVPAGATLTVINSEGAYVPLKMLNFDTTYVNVTVNTNVYLQVLAENGVTQIIYQLIPTTTADEAFITSDLYSVSQRDLLISFVPGGTIVSTFMANIVPNAGSTMKLVNKMGQVRVDGYVADDDKVVVTSANGKVTKAYYIAKLATRYITETTYLAYILSNVYMVDQVMYKVDGVSGAETVSQFLTKVTPSTGASVAVVDKNGVVKINGDINGGDKVRVTSADGKIVNMYAFGPLTSAPVVGDNGIEMYPNPTSDVINVSGVKAGNRIQVYNSVGVSIRDIEVQNSIERISLRNQPVGIYMVIVSDNNKLISRFKAIKQ